MARVVLLGSRINGKRVKIIRENMVKEQMEERRKMGEEG